MAAVKKLKSNPKLAVITGISGQDGSYLCELLLEKGYKVHGLVRPSAQRQQTLNRPLREGVTLHYGDMSDLGRLIQILGSIQDIDEIYHLAAQSHVGVSFETPLSTSDTNAMGTLRLLEAMRVLGLGKTTRFYNAGTSELYGSDMPAPQTEETPFHPVSPYATAKQFQYWTTVNFREAYGFHASNGILFNHESPRRGTTFVTRKITTQVALIACGLLESFELGNLNAVRDWGHAKDYMYGAHLILQQPKGGDYVLASGQAYSVRQFVEAAFGIIGVKIKWSGTGLDEIGTDSVSSKVHVRVNPKYYRTLENETLLGSAEKARRVLGWQPKYTFDDLVREMVLSDIRAVKAGKMFAHTYLDLDWLVDESSEAPKAPIYGIESNGDIHDNGQNTAVQLTA
ncbi:GDP-mannose 4-6-dehydratase [Penicillium hordei]|uniref:GDP-mannose 4,6-dehydratase n=1 Tax=Penicillium hordei TaxID=40994 RepID=A0AAD6GYH8_9EURO|nr:GDP-mannose 4-6-dehydratase [Penicillium hordei]KAJ5598445.1 GDP-mannose 4-6-dehydratase [Penicillium hordei]